MKWSILVVVVLLYGVMTVEAQQAGKVPRIGLLIGTSTFAAETRTKAFREGMQELGYIEGKNILVDYRYGEGSLERMPSLVAELLELKVEVIVAGNLSAIRAAKQATKTTPIVIITTTDPVADGLVDSLARPGGNITGLTRLTRDLSGKRLELLKEMIPKISRVGILWDASGIGASSIAFKEYGDVAPHLKLRIQSLEVRGPNPDLEGAFRAGMKGRATAIIAVRGAALNSYLKSIADLAIKHRLPTMSEGSEYVDAGGLVSYATNDADQFRRAATYVDKILKGRKPFDLPVEQPMKFELVINLKTAKQIGLNIPQWTLMKADRVIK
jgi:putative ABC transport system substrate-binding protein